MKWKCRNAIISLLLIILQTLQRLTATAAEMVINKPKGHFARFGVSKVAETDFGRQFTPNEFRNFCKGWNFIQISPSRGYLQSDGRAESAVKRVQQIFTANEKQQDHYKALLELRNTPQAMQPSTGLNSATV
ncbi:endogenous retrovirus group K member 113 Pol protein-like [Elysia marginata]|uniref:Endogenous retrovirus group K member 113 Pol protein-like n=1 Tax=Elysia marginata TaxID=1093978 RepID=A0AAV4FUY2_9GAST|nr:endogenous retrovirus group K member 113 Pol protein-like [Elysia marginata]